MCRADGSEPMGSSRRLDLAFPDPCVAVKMQVDSFEVETDDGDAGGQTPIEMCAA